MSLWADEPTKSEKTPDQFIKLVIYFYDIMHIALIIIKMINSKNYNFFTFTDNLKLKFIVYFIKWSNFSIFLSYI